MNIFQAFLNALGGLHDVPVVSIEWQVQAKTLEFVFDDLYANFAGTPEYPGRRKGVIRLHGLSDLSIDIESTERLRVFEFLPDEDRTNVIVVRFSPGGHISARFSSVEHPMNELLRSSGEQL